MLAAAGGDPEGGRARRREAEGEDRRERRADPDEPPARRAEVRPRAAVRARTPSAGSPMDEPRCGRSSRSSSSRGSSRTCPRRRRPRAPSGPRWSSTRAALAAAVRGAPRRARRRPAPGPRRRRPADRRRWWGSRSPAAGARSTCRSRTATSARRRSSRSTRCATRSARSSRATGRCTPTTARRAMHALAQLGLALRAPGVDTELASRLLLPTRREHALADVARERIACELPRDPSGGDAARKSERVAVDGLEVERVAAWAGAVRGGAPRPRPRARARARGGGGRARSTATSSGRSCRCCSRWSGPASSWTAARWRG